MENIMEISHLHKSFGDVKAVQDLNFRVKKGELFAFLGVNGAGKSTTINIICGELRKDSGGVTICGTDLDKEPDSIRRKLGVEQLRQKYLHGFRQRRERNGELHRQWRHRKPDRGVCL